MSKNKSRIQSVEYKPSTFFQQSDNPGFKPEKHPLANKEDNLDLMKVFTLAREVAGKANTFFDNAAAVKISAPHLREPIVTSAMSTQFKSDPTKKIGHSERIGLMDALNRFIPSGEGRRPGEDFTSSDWKDQRVETLTNFSAKAEQYRGTLELAAAQVGVMTERTPCEYGDNNCQSFVNNILPEGSNVGHTVNLHGIYGAINQAPEVARAHNQIVASYDQYRSESRPLQQQYTFNLPKPTIPAQKPYASVSQVVNSEVYNTPIIATWEDSPDRYHYGVLGASPGYYSPSPVSSFSPQSPEGILRDIEKDPNIKVVRNMFKESIVAIWNQNSSPKAP